MWLKKRHFGEDPKAGAGICSHLLPVHQIDQHLRVFLVLLHLDCVRQDHVQIKNEVLNLVMENKSMKAESAADGPPAGSQGQSW